MSEKTEKEYSNTPKVTEVTVNQVEQEDMFLIINRDGKYMIALTNQIVSKNKFDTLNEARKYINAKPWELILNTAAVMAKFATTEEVNLK